MQEEKTNKKQEEETHLQLPYQKKYDNIKMLIRSAFKQLDKIQDVIESMEQEDKKAYYQGIPGTEGYFDGQNLIADDGRKTEVPGNYAAKSRLVYGDRLKVFSESGKQIFKQITKVERKKIEGVLGKKEGSWYILSKEGTYKIADLAAEFNKADLNDKATAFIPLSNQNVPYAALDKVLKAGETGEGNRKITAHPIASKVLHPKPTEVKIEVKKETKTVKPKEKNSVKKPSKQKEEEKKENDQEKPRKEFIDNIMEDDDLR